MDKIEMKMKVKDEITGFVGTTVSRCEYLTGCIHWQVLAACDDNKPGKFQWIEEERLKPFGRKVTKKREYIPRPRGGDPDDPPGMDKPPGVTP